MFQVFYGIITRLHDIDYCNLYKSVLARCEADWLGGINAIQAFSNAVGKVVYSYGRIQDLIHLLICKKILIISDM